MPRGTRFPVELRTPPGFRPDDPATWPSVDGAEARYRVGQQLEPNVRRPGLVPAVGAFFRQLEARPPGGGN